jgi:hypothetical protein
MTSTVANCEKSLQETLYQSIKNRAADTNCPLGNYTTEDEFIKYVIMCEASMYRGRKLKLSDVCENYFHLLLAYNFTIQRN